ncbi:MAG: LysR family transcriptional regulator [Geminicoccaceae bacterium]
MDLRQLRYFCAVAEELNIGRAAARLNIVQPALSRQMQALETDLGVTLLERLPRGVRLTSAGERLLEDARRILDDVDRTADRARRAGRGDIGRLVIGFVDAIVSADVVSTSLRAMQERHPGIVLRLINMSSINQYAALRKGQVDVGFAFYRDTVDPEIDGFTIIKDEVMLAVAEDQPLAAKSSVGLEVLYDHALIGFPREVAPRFYQDIETSCRKAELPFRTAHEGLSSMAILGLVRAGLGVAFQPRSAEHHLPKGVVLLPINDLSLTTSLDLAWRTANPSPALRYFTDIVGEAVSKMPINRIGVPDPT